MYCDPIDHALSHFSSMAEEMSYESYVEKEMYNHQRSALVKLKTIVHPDYVEEFAKILSFAHREGLPEAEKISNHLFISQKEYAGIEEDFNSMKTFIQEDRFFTEGESRYENYYADII